MSPRHISLAVRSTAVLAAAVVLAASGTHAGAIATDTRTWIPATHAGQPVVKGSALDVSFVLDAPAGRHGFVSVKGDGFVFADGTPARFWGGNFFGEANFPDKADADRLADIVARAGANIVRMHHLDVVAPWTDKVVQRSLLGGQQPATTRTLDQGMLDRFEYLVSCFKRRGVYVFLSPISSRMVRPGDAFPGPAGAIADVSAGFKFEGMFDPYLIDLQQEYLRQLLTHRNPYTGLALVDDPVLAMTEVVNENTTLWPQAKGSFAVESEYYRTMLRTRFNRWLRETIGSRAVLEQRWAANGRVGLGASEDPAADTVEIPATYRDRSTGYSDARVTDTFRFLGEVQDRFYAQMRRFFKDVGLRVPLTGSNHWTNDVVDLRQNAGFDFVDRHQYWTHPEGTYNYEQGQRIDAKPMVKEADGGALGSLARRRVAGRPYTVSEWHHCLPNPYRAEGPMLMAAYGALQGWHPMQYAYWASLETSPAMINSFEGMFDPTQVNLIPAASLLFVRGDVAESRDAYYDPVGQETTLDPLRRLAVHPGTVLAGKYGLAFTDLPAVPSAPSLVGRVKAGDGVVQSATGELTWNARDGVVTIDAPRTQAVVGFGGGRRIATRDVSFELTTPFAVVVVSSLTSDPITSAARLLVSTSGDARWSGTEVSPDGQRILTTGRFPFLMEPVEGRVAIKGSAGRVYRLDTNGARLGELPAVTSAGRLELPLAAGNRAMHYEVVR